MPITDFTEGEQFEPRKTTAAVSRVPWLRAYAWYRSEPLPGFGGRAAMQLVQEGKAQQVLDCIDAVDAGVFA